MPVTGPLFPNIPPPNLPAAPHTTLPGVVNFLRALLVWLQQQFAALRKILGPGGGGTTIIGSLYISFDLVGTKDGTNVTFTWPFVLLTAVNGTPAGLLNFRGSRTYPTTTNPPPPGFFFLVDSSTLTVAVSDAPQAGDVLQWDWALAQ